MYFIASATIAEPLTVCAGAGVLLEPLLLLFDPWLLLLAGVDGVVFAEPLPCDELPCVVSVVVLEFVVALDVVEFDVEDSLAAAS
jgi:hypothetical protein